MQLGFVGLGRMGGNMVHRLARGGHEVVAFNRSPGPVEQAVKNGAHGSTSLEDMVNQLATPRNIWLMLPAGDVTDQYLDQLMAVCAAGRPVRRRRQLEMEGHHRARRAHQGARLRVRRLRHQRRHLGARDRLLDHGRRISRGLRARRAGGQDAGARGRLRAGRQQRRRPLRQDGPQRRRVRHDAGLRRGLRDPGAFELRLDLRQAGEIWQHGSVVRSWLLDLAVSAFEKDPKLEALEGYVSTTRARAAGRSRQPSTRTLPRR